MFFEHQISLSAWFLKGHVTEDAENTALHHRNKLILQSKTVVLYCNNISQYYCSYCIPLFLWSHECSIGENKTLPSKTYTIEQMINFWMVVYRNSLQQQNECAWFSADNSVLGNVWVHTNIVEFFSLTLKETCEITGFSFLPRNIWEAGDFSGLILCFSNWDIKEIYLDFSFPTVFDTTKGRVHK